ncbi:MAG: hypothetical protein NT062_17395, partial [Proteobacteria bacterium]|nr:hypothetical protein [Pseudomonadota bacterium]
RGQPLSAHAFLASCERAMASVPDVRGVMFARFSGALHALHYRREVVDRARLYRAGERGVPARPLTVSLQAFTMPGRIVVRSHDRPALTYVAYGVSERGIRPVAEQAIPEVEHAAWQDALVAANMRVGGMVGALVWAFGSDDYVLWRSGVDAGQGTRTAMADVLGVIASPTGIRLRRRGAREDLLVALDDARACATCARELARWRGCAFVDET